MEISPVNLKPKPKFLKWVSKRLKWIIPATIVIILGFLVSTSSPTSPGLLTSLFGDQLLVDEAGRVNILLLGIAGPGHDGPNLTDTIMVASLNTKTNQVSLISLPRDLWLDKQQAKVNTLYQMGLNRGNGLDLAETQIGDILGLKLLYGVRVDFSGFTKAVDQIDGIDVLIENTFDDWAYPIEGKEADLCGNQDTDKTLSNDEAKSLGVSAGVHHVLIDPSGKIATASADNQKQITYSDLDVLKYFPCRFEHLHFDKGLAHMDGTTALKYVRSRHGTGVEGSDFARSKRQQLVIEAFKDKALSLGTLTDPQKIISLIKTFGGSVEVDFPTSKYVEALNLIRKIKGVHSWVIDGNGEKQVLIHSSEGDYGGAWVLIPPKNDFNIVHDYIADLLAKDATASASKK